MIKKSIYAIVLVAICFAFKSDKPAYRLYTEKGKKAQFKDVLKASLDADIVLFGELHNNPISHWLQLELTQAMYQEEGNKLALGAEMFEADNQLLLNEYTTGLITNKNFDAQARLWPNYKTDYKPLVDFAREHHLHFVASNVPRRYASIVFKKGVNALDSLSGGAKQLMAPLPIPFDPELSNYKSMSMMMSKEHPNEKLAQAQALKDATMAYRVGRYLKRNGGKLIHFNGTYHSQDFQGMVWYLKEYYPNLKVVTIATEEQQDIYKLSDDNQGKANFIIAVTENMTKTH